MYAPRLWPLIVVCLLAHSLLACSSIARFDSPSPQAPITERWPEEPPPPPNARR